VKLWVVVVVGLEVELTIGADASRVHSGRGDRIDTSLDVGLTTGSDGLRGCSTEFEEAGGGGGGGGVASRRGASADDTGAAGSGRGAAARGVSISRTAGAAARAGGADEPWLEFWHQAVEASRK